MSEKDKLMLKQMLKLTPQQQKSLSFMNDADSGYILFLCEYVLNVLKGNVKSSVGKLQPFTKSLRTQTQIQKPLAKKKTLKSNSGLKTLKSIGKPCTNYLDLCRGS